MWGKGRGQAWRPLSRRVPDNQAMEEREPLNCEPTQFTVSANSRKEITSSDFSQRSIRELKAESDPGR
jgi:hypothetical protein